MSNTKIQKDGNVSFEAAMKRLDEISELLEKENVDLERALALYEEGIGLVRKCNEQLEDAERKIKILKMTPDGEVVEEDFLSAKNAD
jgi:exodeoxyribonuclease VII small subunit